eukprot:4123822-Pyramimonas_sp.AAC.1
MASSANTKQSKTAVASARPLLGLSSAPPSRAEARDLHGAPRAPSSKARGVLGIAEADDDVLA